MTFARSIPLVFCAVIHSIMMSGQTGESADRPSPLEVIGMWEQTVLTHSSVAYRATIRTKFSNLPDTFSFTEKVLLERIPQDTLFGGRILFTTEDSAFAAYDLNYCYTCDMASDSCDRYDPKKGENWPIESDLRTMILWRAFLKPSRLQGLPEMGVKFELLPDTIVNATSCWHVRSLFPNKQQVTNDIRDAYYSKESHVPLLEIRSVLVEGDVQYSHLLIHEFSFDTGEAPGFDINKIMPHAVLTDYVDQEREAILPVGNKAPTLIGNIYGSSEGVDSIPYAGHVTLVDFWYMQCPPCRSSVPVLDSLYGVYKDRGVQFVGVNYWDKKADNLDQLPAFLEKRPIHYPILFVEEGFEESFSVQAHPAFFIIDKDGTVAANYEGFGPGMAKSWAAKLDELLK